MYLNFIPVEFLCKKINIETVISKATYLFGKMAKIVNIISKVHSFITFLKLYNYFF